MKNLSKMNSLKNQRGLTMLSWVAVMAVASFCGLFAFNVVPMYAENTYVVAGLKQLADSGTSFDDMTDAEIKKKLTTFYSLNNVRSEGPQHIVIDRSSKNFIVKVDYELRANLFYNIDIVTSFKNHLDSSRKSECCKPRDTK